MSDSIRVLHVDDEPNFADVAGECLERHSDRIDVVTATDAREGLDVLARSDVDCVVSDYEMPGLDGIEFFEAVREDHGEVPFILFTGRGSEEIASEAVSAGVTDYLQKESGMEQYAVLANRVENAVDQYRAERAVERTQRRFRTLVEEATDAILVVDPDATITFATASSESVLGRSPEDLVGTDGLAPIHPEDVDRVAAAFAELIEDPEGYRTVEFRYERPDGTWIWAEARGRNLLEDPVVEGVVVYARDVTDRKEREAAIERQTRAMENAPVGITISDPDHPDNPIVYANEGFERLTGYSTEEVVGRNCRFLQGEDTDQGTVARIREAIDAGESLTTELRNYRADGTEFWNRLTVAPVENDAGEVVNFVGFQQDVTEDRERERQLGQSHDLIETLSTALPDYIFIYDADAEYLDVITGWSGGPVMYDPEELVGRTAGEILPESSAREVRAAIDRALSTGELQTVEYHLETESGPYWYEGNVAPIPDGYEGDPAVVFTARDITERRQYERALAALHDVGGDLADADSVDEVCRRAVEASADLLAFDESVVAVENDGILEVRGSSEGLHREAFANRRTDQGIGGRTYRTGEPLVVDDVFETEYAADDDSYRSVLSLPVGDYGVFQALASEVGAFDDTDLELAQLLVAHVESALDRLERERALEGQNERLEEFTSIVSHDLRNPLETLTGAVTLAEETGDPEYFDRSRAAIDRMNQLIDDLLTLARQGEEVTEETALDLGSMVEACWRNVETGGARLAVEAERTVVADESRLRQLLENLVRNAVEHGGEGVTVTVGDFEDGFYVADDGTGIPPGERDRVFEPGYSTDPDGTGFGLKIVAEIAAAHGWEVTVTEGEAGGARFEFTGVER